MYTRWLQVGSFSGTMRSHERGMSAGGCGSKAGVTPASWGPTSGSCSLIAPWCVTRDSSSRYSPGVLHELVSGDAGMWGRSSWKQTGVLSSHARSCCRTSTLPTVRSSMRCVVRDSNSGHQLLLPPAHMFASRTMQGVGIMQPLYYHYPKAEQAYRECAPAVSFHCLSPRFHGAETACLICLSFR